MDREFGLEDAYAVRTPKDNLDLYESWADSYEESFIEGEGYRYHERIADLYASNGGTGPVLDVGCGTGVVGVELAQRGIGPIDGVDISPAMLSLAAEKRLDGLAVYRDLIEADLTNSPTSVSSRYLGLVSAGTFTHGHLGPHVIDDLVSLAAPSALMVIGINSAHFEEMGFRAHLDRVLGAYETTQVPIYEEEDSENPDRLATVVICRLS